jgi:hypothetical protein
MNRDPAAAESLDRLAKQRLGRLAAAQERGRPGSDAQRPVVPLARVRSSSWPSASDATS